MSRRVRGEGLARVFAGHLSLRFSGCCPRCFFVPSDRRLLVAGTWNCDLNSTPLLSSDPFLAHFFVAVALFWGARWFVFFFFPRGGGHVCRERQFHLFLFRPAAALSFSSDCTAGLSSAVPSRGGNRGHPRSVPSRRRKTLSLPPSGVTWGGSRRCPLTG